MTFWEVDILGVDISGFVILGVDILGVDILGRIRDDVLARPLLTKTTLFPTALIFDYWMSSSI